MNRGTVHVRLFKEAVEALEKAASALEHERRVEEWGFPDIKTGINLNCEVRRYEIDLITRALEESGGSLVEAARLLGLSSTTLHMKLKRHGIARKSVRNRGRLRRENR
jgi:DNA-binding NtrC family response regulator